MTNSQRLATVRARLLRWLAAEHIGHAEQSVGTGQHESAGPNSQPAAILSESILIRNEFYCGRQFHTESHRAVWFIEEDELKIYRTRGELVCVLSSEEIDAVADDAVRPADSPDVLKLPAPIDRNDESDDEIRRAA